MLEHLRGTDIYLLDMMMRERIAPGMRILDAGCGKGRNIRYLLSAGFDVCAIDQDPTAVEYVRSLAPHLPAENFRCESIGALSFPNQYFDFIICNTVLHFADDDAHFDAMLRDLFSKLKPGATFFSRLATSIGIEHQIQKISGRRHRSLDGGERYLADAALLHRIEEREGLRPLDPLKTTIVENQRAMTTWVLAAPDHS